MYAGLASSAAALQYVFHDVCLLDRLCQYVHVHACEHQSSAAEVYMLFKHKYTNVVVVILCGKRFPRVHVHMPVWHKLHLRG